MSEVILHATITLDSFMAGPNSEMDWMHPYVRPNAVADEMIRTTGAVLMGRRTYQSAP